MNEIKFCKDCKHYQKKIFLGAQREDGEPIFDIIHECYRPSLVTGEPEPSFAGAERCSTQNYECGPEGKYFEKRK